MALKIGVGVDDRFDIADREIGQRGHEKLLNTCATVG
jgi:hypothetical protein